jgi:hypoxanthine phosphoribosyltransferase
MVASSDSDRELWITWDDYHNAIERLAVMIHQSGWQFDQILALARGGLRPGDILSRLFKVPLAILSASSYREQTGTQRGELRIASHITSPAGGLSGRILLVDDLVDSGITLEKVQANIQDEFPEISEVRSAVIWYKACSTIRPDFYLEYLESNPWIHQPFEKYDGINPDELFVDSTEKGAVHPR